MRILWAGLLVGFVLNLLGWLGNVFLLGPLWQDAFSDVTTTSWRDSPWRDVLSLAPDFIYGVATCWLYAALAVRFAFVVFVPGAWLADRLMRAHVSATP